MDGWRRCDEHRGCGRRRRRSGDNDGRVRWRTSDDAGTNACHRGGDDNARCDPGDGDGHRWLHRCGGDDGGAVAEWRCEGSGASTVVTECVGDMDGPLNVRGSDEGAGPDDWDAGLDDYNTMARRNTDWVLLAAINEALQWV